VGFGGYLWLCVVFYNIEILVQEDLGFLGRCEGTDF